MIEVETEPGDPALGLEASDADSLPLPSSQATQTQKDNRTLLRIEPAAKARRIYLRLGGASATPTPYRIRFGG